MATQVLTVAPSSNCAAIVRVAYDDVTGDVLGVRAVIERGPGTHQTTNVPPNIQLGRDPETNAVTITRGNAVLSLAWGES